MVKYENKEMVLDVVKNSAVMVIEGNAQGILELDKVGRRILTEFPEVALQYKAACQQGLVDVGQALYIEAWGFEFIFLINQYYRVGEKVQDTSDKIVFNTIKCIDKLKQKMPNKKFISGILNRHSATWQKIAGHLAASGLSWTVYRE